MVLSIKVHVFIPLSKMGSLKGNRHILEVTRALIITCNVPKFYWGDVILTATYLINRMPNKVISFETPLKMLQSVFPTTHLESNISFHVFGYIVFVHAYPNNKLDVSFREDTPFYPKSSIQGERE